MRSVIGSCDAKLAVGTTSIMVTFSLVVVRHGATDANEQGIIQGQSDHSLNEAGRRQALLLGRHFRQCQLFSSFTHAYSSDLSRAKETAGIILRSLSEGDGGYGSKWNDDQNGSRLICDARLRERKYGVLEGKSLSVHKQAAMKSNVAPAEYTPEGGETLRNLYDRVSDFFRDLCGRVASASRAQMLPTTPSRSSIVTTPPSPKIGDTLSQQQLQNGGTSNRNNRVQMPISKVSRTSSLIPLPEQVGPVTTTPPSSAAVTITVANASPIFYLPSPCKMEQESTVQASTAGVLEEDNESVASQVGDPPSAYSVQAPSHDEFSPFASSRDSGISAVSDGSLFVDTQLAEAPIVEPGGDRPSKRTYSACSSPGFSTCTASPCEPSDMTGDDAMDKPPPPSASMQTTNSWAYLYGSGVRTVGARKVSVQSIASDDANFPDLDAQILVVTHGGAIRELFRYFVDELGCLMIGGKGAALRPCPNTGVSSFMVNVNADNGSLASPGGGSTADTTSVHPKNVSIICLGLHSKEHLSPWPTPPPANSEADAARETDWFSRRPHTPPCDVSDFFVNDDNDEEDESADSSSGITARVRVRVRLPNSSSSTSTSSSTIPAATSTLPKGEARL